MTDEADTRATLSGMTEITERTIARVVYRDTDLDALYRECPTAFWLAPDGDDALPIRYGPILPLPVPAVDAVETDAIDPPRVDGLAVAVAYGLVAAGPVFAATALTLSEVSDHGWDAVGRGLMSLVAAPLTVPVGAILAALPVLVGVLALGTFGRSVPQVRAPGIWAATGAAMGAAIAALFGAGGSVGLALVATSVACARLARAAVRWTDPQPA